MLARRLAAGALAAALCAAAFAHTGERGYILLLPTGLYVTGGALAVALSFVVMAGIPSARFSQVATAELPIAIAPQVLKIATSAITLLCLALLLVEGFAGSRDPLENPLPLVVWTLWWVGFTFAVALLGNLWSLFNPWIALSPVTRFFARAIPTVPYPERLGYWPAVVLLLAFAWFELVYPAPQDPFRLAIAVIAYCVITVAAMARYGAERWLEKGDAFSVFFRLVGRLSPLRMDAGRRISVGLPCRGLLHAKPLPASGTAFVIVALGSVSFDGLSRTFWWLSLAGANPLEHPGRSSLVAWNAFGLIATACALGLSHREVTASVLTNHDSVHTIWNAQVAGIVLAHVAAVFVAHAIALRKLDARQALLSQLPMTVLMVAYTVFGLWLLSTPVAG